MKIFLGPAGVPTRCKGGTVNGIKCVHDIGLNAMEVEFVHGVKMGNSLAKDVGLVAQKLGVRLSVHAPYFINLCNPEKVKDSMKRILDSCERAYQMSADVVVFHPGYYGKLSEDKCFNAVLDACKEMTRELNKRGIKNVHLGLETTGKKSQFGTLEEIVEICKKVKQCVPVIDFAHIYARNSGKIDYNEIFDKLKVLKPKHIHSHFSGIEYSEKGERRHLPITRAKPDFKELAKVIFLRKISITIISESPVLEQDSLLMKKEFEKLGYNF